MLQSKLFTKTRREDPKDEQAKNAKLLIRAGFIHKEAAGIYDYLPLGLMVLEKIKNIVREEMNEVGGVELQMSALQNPALYEKTGRWSDEKVDNWFKTELKAGGRLGLGLTHEEAIVAMLSSHLGSYKDLPIAVYQIQKKFRNEIRVKSGIMRGREFTMKDLYSFHTGEDDLDDYYDKVKGAYERIFERVGLGERTYVTFASGGIFSKYSHEFQTLCEAGEDTIYVSENRKIAVNKEVLTDEVLNELGLERNELIEKKAIETGNIFKLGTKYSEPLGLRIINEKGEAKPVIAGSYGLGIDRLMGAIAEVYADDKGLVWPRAVAPFLLHLVVLGKDINVSAEGDPIGETSFQLYEELRKAGVLVLCDDRPNMSAGEKLADADLLGLPFRLVVSERTLKDGRFELTERVAGETSFLSETELLNKFRA